MKEFRTTKLEGLDKAYKQAVLTVVSIGSLWSELHRSDSYVNTPGMTGIATIDRFEHCLRITMPGLPEKDGYCMAKGSPYYQTTKEFWQKSIIAAATQFRLAEPIRHAAIIIKLFYKEKAWDVDNHAVIHIINGLRFSGMLFEDAHTNMSYSVLGAPDREGCYRTEIYVTEEENFALVYAQLKSPESYYPLSKNPLLNHFPES